MAQAIGRELLPYPEEIVHHTDLDKHHNCIADKITCGDKNCMGNLELLSGDAAKAHLRIHYPKIYEDRYGKPYNGYNTEPLEPTPEELRYREEREAYYADGGF